jgi:hypothetical protein
MDQSKVRPPPRAPARGPSRRMAETSYAAAASSEASPSMRKALIIRGDPRAAQSSGGSPPWSWIVSTPERETASRISSRGASTKTPTDATKDGRFVRMARTSSGGR